MRIIAGRYRGRRLSAVPAGLRPSSDRLRETLFGVLGTTVEGSIWVEPFAGTGAVSLEALSRGAQELILNDSAKQAVVTIRKNLTRCGVDSGVELSDLDAFRFLRGLRLDEVDFIFLDPPYDFTRYGRLLATVAGLPCLRPHSLIIIEYFKKTRFEVPEVLEVRRTLTVGDSCLLLMQLNRRPSVQGR